MRVRGDENYAVVAWLAGQAVRPMWHLRPGQGARALNPLAELVGSAQVAELGAALASGSSPRVLAQEYELRVVPEELGGGFLVALRLAPSFFERALAEASQLWSLTRRQREVLRELCDGWKPEEIARRLGMAAGTAKVHIRELLSRSGCASQVEMVSKLLRMG